MWGWPSASLGENSGVFGDFNQCLAYEYNTQDTCASSGSTTSIPSPSHCQILDSECEVRGYLGKINNVNPDLSILGFTSSSPEKNGMRPLPISKGLFEHIIQAFDLCESFLTVLDTGLATYTAHIPTPSEQSRKTSNNAQFVIQQNRSYSAYSMAVMFSLETKKTRVLIFGVDANAFLDLFAYLGSLPVFPCGPMLVPAVALELQARTLTSIVKDCHDRIHAIETTTGMRQFNFAYEKRGLSPKDWKQLDFVSITRDLSSFLSRFAFIKMQAETGAYLVQQMAQTAKSFGENFERDNSRSSSDKRSSITSKLKHIESWYLGIAARCRYLSERTTAQTQTVYCLIASQDTSISTDIARASRDIAAGSHKESELMRGLTELNRRDTELMIRVAKDSRAVAIAAARDSASMQVIAAVTILFLPATFTATFFSMTFFDFLDAEQPRVSPWCWMYFLITASLTLVIQLIWAIISKRKKEKITQETIVTT